MYEKRHYGPGHAAPVEALDQLVTDAAACNDVSKSFSTYEAVIWDKAGNAAYVTCERSRGEYARGTLTPITEEQAEKLIRAAHLRARSW